MYRSELTRLRAQPWAGHQYHGHQSTQQQQQQHPGGTHTRKSPLSSTNSGNPVNHRNPNTITITSSSSQHHTNPHGTAPTSLLNRNTPLGSSSMSPGVMGHSSASPYQQQAMHTGGYTYGAQTFTRTHNPYATYQQRHASHQVAHNNAASQGSVACNGYGNSQATMGCSSAGMTSSSAGHQRSTNRDSNNPSSNRDPNRISSSSAAGSTRNNNNNDSPHSDVPLSSTNVYIRGLDPKTTDDDLRQKCDCYGAILSTKAIMDKTTGQCKGYGFVDFESAEAALRAVEGLNQEGKVQAQMAKQQEQDPTNLYFANLPPNFTEQDLQKTLERFGMVISTRILKNQDGASRGVGFARMDKKELCDQIIREMNGKLFVNNSTQPLLVKFADSGKKPKARAVPMASLYSNVAQMEIPQYYTNAQYEQLNGGYLRGSPATAIPYIIPAPSQYVLNAQPQYHHVIPGFTTDAQLSGLTSQLHNISLANANAVVSQPGTADMNGSGTNATIAALTAAVAGQPTAHTSHLPQMAAMHPSYTTYPVYPYPIQYSMQTGDPNMATVTMVPSATPPTGYVPAGDMLIHTDGTSIYASQPPPPQLVNQSAAQQLAAAGMTQQAIATAPSK
ncbi:unnamed protein product [Anisakis simplex]|uniref:Protein alan shepard (inferred by orthology to a D. melanogaster protein) n=1 Tax=Anisakis simplex TaxID=6269 RepID=A0A0M3JVA9_ANISI|nr:unnamed protein product [Anisakis simplex]